MRDLEQPPEGGQATTNHGRSKINDGRGSRNSERLRMFGNLPRAGPGGPGDGALLVRSGALLVRMGLKRRWGNQVANLLRNRGLCGQRGATESSQQPTNDHPTNKPTNRHKPTSRPSNQATAKQTTRQPTNRQSFKMATNNQLPSASASHQQPAPINSTLARPWGGARQAPRAARPPTCASHHEQRSPVELQHLQKISIRVPPQRKTLHGFSRFLKRLQHFECVRNSPDRRFP